MSKGARLAFGDESLRRWVLMPFFLLMALVASVMTVAVICIVRAKANNDGWLVLLGLLGAAFVGYVGALLFGIAPFSGVLSERTEALTRGRPVPSAPWSHVMQEAYVGVGHAIANFALFVALWLAVVAAHAIVPFLAPLLWAAGLVQTTLFIAYGYLDPVLSRRRLGFRDKWRYLGKHRAECVGFGATTALLLAVPGFGLVISPIAVVGATLLALELEARETS